MTKLIRSRSSHITQAPSPSRCLIALTRQVFTPRLLALALITPCFTPTMLWAATLTPVSATSSNVLGNGNSDLPSVNGDATFVAFASDALNLSSVAYGQKMIYLKNLTTGAITPISSTSSSDSANSNSDHPLIVTHDGASVIFQSYADNLVTGDRNGDSDIFLKDTKTGALKLLSSVGGVAGNLGSLNPALSGNGQKLVFQSRASNLATNYLNGASDIFVADLQSGALSLVSQSPLGNGDSVSPAINGDGTKVAFASDANNLVANDKNNSRDVFLKDLQSGAIKLISADANGSVANQFSDNPSISTDGTKIAFRSYATSLTNTGSSGYSNIFLKDFASNKMLLVSNGLNGQEVNGNSWNPVLSPDGKTLAFVSEASNLVKDDTNAAADIFVYQLEKGTLARIGDNTSTGDSLAPAFSGDSAKIAFTRWKSNAKTDPSNFSNVYLTDNPFNANPTPVPCGDNSNPFSAAAPCPVAENAEYDATTQLVTIQDARSRLHTCRSYCSFKAMAYFL